MRHISGENPQPQTSTTNLSRLPSLDGWRAVSILMVLGFHSTFAAGFPVGLKPPFFDLIFNGDLGVRFFFTISGFLITWLVVLELDQNGSVNLKHFYARRCLRIFPVYFTFLGVLAGLHLFASTGQSVASWIGNLTFTRNFVAGSASSEHLWSLSVEEQFYLIWPTALLLSGAGRKLRTAMLILGAVILLAPVFRGMWITRLYPEILKPVFCANSFFLRFDSLAFGCLCAILLAREREWVGEYLKSRSWLVAILAIALIFFSNFLDPWLIIRLGPTLQALGFSILLLQSVIMPDWGFYRGLNWAWVRQIGVLSYSLYIWQQLFWSPPESLALSRVWWMGLWIIPLFSVASVSYYGIERPFLRLRKRFR